MSIFLFNQLPLPSFNPLSSLKEGSLCLSDSPFEFSDKRRLYCPPEFNQTSKSNHKCLPKFKIKRLSGFLAKMGGPVVSYQNKYTIKSINSADSVEARSPQFSIG
jgi:hypothetical protein